MSTLELDLQSDSAPARGRECWVSGVGLTWSPGTRVVLAGLVEECLWELMADPRTHRYLVTPEVEGMTASLTVKGS